MLSPITSPMARLEKIDWPSQEVPRKVHMKIHGSVNIPESSLPESRAMISPIESVDSGRPGSMPLPSHKYFIHGGPGFSIAILDSTTGAVDPIPVPVPLSSPVSEEPNCAAFSTSEVLSMSVVGENQVWVGTETSSLHVFDLTSVNLDLRLSNHAYTRLEDPAICILARQLYDSNSPARLARRIEILLGSPNGNLTVVSGEANERGGLKTPLNKSPRQLVQLGSFEERGNTIVKCVVAVNGPTIEEDKYWCGCGPSIVILRRFDWKVTASFDGAAGAQLPLSELAGNIHVGDLISTDVGIWSYLTHSSTMILWDSKTYTPKLKITCCNYCTTNDGWVDDFAKITAVNFTYPLLYAGTNGGHLLVFKILEEAQARSRTPMRVSRPSLSYRLSSAIHCTSQPILNIHPTPIQEGFGRLSLDSPLCTTPGPTAHVLVIYGGGEDSASSSSQLQLYELNTSPRESPLVSPLSGRSSVSSAISGSISLQRLSKSGSLPPITLHSVSPQAISFLPLKNSD